MVEWHRKLADPEPTTSFAGAAMKQTTIEMSRQWRAAECADAKPGTMPAK